MSCTAALSGSGSARAIGVQRTEGVIKIVGKQL
jgi:hypothetical protein